MVSLGDVLRGIFFLLYPMVQVGKGFGRPVFRPAFDGDYVSRAGDGTYTAANTPISIYIIWITHDQVLQMFG